MASWLSGLATKAEDMLNSVDKAAASTLSKEAAEKNENEYSSWKAKSPSTSTRPVSSFTSQLNRDNSGKKASNPAKPPNYNGSPASITSSSSVPSNLNKMNDSAGAPSSMSTSFHSQNSSSKKKDSDDELFEFLNSSDTLDGNGSGGNKRKDKVTGLRNSNLSNGHSRQSSTSSVSSHRSGKTPEATTVIDMVDDSDIAASGTAVPDQAQNEVLENQDIISPPTQSMHQEPLGMNEDKSTLEMQNQLLSNEIASLNQEMASVIKRAKESQEELNKVRKKLDNQASHLSTQDGIVRELRARENDLTEALAAKDSQLAILRVRFEEADKELMGNKALIDKLKGENDRILNDHTSVSGAQNEALDGLKSKFSEAEYALKREHEMLEKSQQEASEQQSKLEGQIQTLSESLTNAERRVNDERTRVSELTIHTKTAKSQAEMAKQELSDYKDKAARILQSKDRLISSLKEGTTGEAGEGGVSLAELELVRQERDLVREELQQGRMTVEGLRTEIQDLELTLQTEQESARETQRHLEDLINTERSRREDAEQEVSRQKQELRFAHEELINQKTGHKRQLQDRDLEIDRLRNQLTTKSASSNSQTELENRLHALTESLIHKQTMVEALSTEKNSLVLQLERLEQKYNILQETSNRTHTTAVHMHDDEEARHRLPGFMRESPLDGDVTRKVKRAAGAIDKFSVRLGVFLRRYPIARVFVICYMALLHVWVMVVLLTYQPEMHGDHDFGPKSPP